MNISGNNNSVLVDPSIIDQNRLPIQLTHILLPTEATRPYDNNYDQTIHRVSVLTRSTIFEAGKRLRLPQCPIIENSLIIWERYRACTWGKTHRQLEGDDKTKTDHKLTLGEIEELYNKAELSAQISILLACKNNNIEVDLNLIIFQFAYLHDRPWLVLGHKTHPKSDPSPSYPPYVPDLTTLKQNLLSLEMEILFQISFQISHTSIYGLLAKVVLDLKRGGTVKGLHRSNGIIEPESDYVKDLANLSHVIWTTVLTYDSVIVIIHQPLSICLAILCLCAEKLGLVLQWENQLTELPECENWWLKYSIDKPGILEAKGKITEILRRSERYRNNSLGI